MKIKEYEIFRSYYCGLCKSIKQRYGQKARVTLTYDCTFLALVLDSLYTETAELKVKNFRCGLHPLKKKKVVHDNFFIDYAADCNVMLAFNKIEDNKIDERKLKDSVASSLLAKSYKKAKLRYPKLTEFVEENLAYQRKLENELCDSVDVIAEPFAKITQKLFSNEELFETIRHINGSVTDDLVEFDNMTIKALEWLGYNIGKWIYIVDCIDDVQDDHKDGNYNPLFYCKPMIENESIEEYKKRISEDILFLLDYSAAEAGKALDLLNVKHGLGILENIIFSGMSNTSEAVVKIK